MDLDKIDRLVAEKVMGWIERRAGDSLPDDYVYHGRPAWYPPESRNSPATIANWRPTRDPKHTLMVIQHFVARGITFRLHSDPGFNEANEHFHAWFSPVDLGPWPAWSRAADFGSAVSLAALRAYRVEVSA